MSRNDINFDDFIDEDDFLDIDEIEETPKKKTKKEVISNVKKLEEHFDIVEVKKFDNYDILTCKNKVNKPGINIDYEVWLNLKCYSSENAANEVLKYIDKLFKNPDETQKQFSLFDENPLEDKTKVENLTFFEAFNSYCLYDYDEYLHTIPQSNEEMIKEFKKCIQMYLDNPAQESDFYCFSDEYNYLRRDAISDREMLTRLYGNFNLNFGISPYVEDIYSVDLSNVVRCYECKGTTHKRFTTRYYGHQLKLSLGGDNYKIFDLYNKEFCDWVREKFNIKRKDVPTDKEVIKEQFKKFSKSFFKDDDVLNEYITKSKNAKDFRKKVIDKLKASDNSTGHMGGGGGPLDDCYSYSIGYDLNHLSFSVAQLNTYREQLGREVILHNDSWKQDYTYVIKLEGNEVFEKMYDYLSNKPVYTQTTLF